MPIDHIGLNVPDVDRAKLYYDEFMPLVGFMPQFGTGYVATDWYGAQLFLYPATEEGEHSRLRSGLSHVALRNVAKGATGTRLVAEATHEPPVSSVCALNLYPDNRTHGLKGGGWRQAR